MNEELEAKINAIGTMLHILLDNLGHKGDLKLALGVKNALSATIQMEAEIARCAGIEEVGELERLREFQDYITKAIAEREDAVVAGRPN